MQHFRNPPPGYGIVPFYWWLGDKLTKERLLWQLDQLEGHHISGLQVNYAHSDQGGPYWGLTYESDPPLFSEEWWELFGWFLQEAKKRGMSVSLSDYTLFAPGQGFFTDWVLKRRPEMQGQMLHQHVQAVCKDEVICVDLPAPPLCAMVVVNNAAHPVEGAYSDGHFTATSPCDGKLRLVYAEPKPYSYDPMHPDAGKEIIDEFFGMFERRFPGECGKGLNFFFSDELEFGIRGNLWNDYFADEFIRRKGYDIRPLLYLVFCEECPEAVPVRLDYYDVIVALEEEHYFRPVYEWHEKRGMTYGCDHGSRGYDAVEFGDYMRTQKYNQGPGCDQPKLASDIIKNKVAASISHLHDRSRVWLEGFYGSGWGTTSAQLTDAIARNFVMGQNLLSLHGLYYSTHGGWWEWAPPCNCFRMPYWKHLSALTGAVERLSYLLTRGKPRCDVAILYPVSAMHGGVGGQHSVDTAFALGRELYSHGVDFDFIDRESLCHGKATRYRFIVPPDMRSIHPDEYRALLDAAKQGVQIVSIGRLPEHSIGDTATITAELAPLCTFVADADAAFRHLLTHAERAVIPEKASEYYVLHRQYDGLDIYMTYGIPKGERCTFRASGKAAWMNPWDGKAYLIPNAEQTADGVVFSMPVEAGEFQVFVFGTVETDSVLENAPVASTLPLSSMWDFELLPTMDNTWGDYELPPTEGLLPCQVKEVHCDGATYRVGYGPYFLTKEAFANEAEYQSALEQARLGQTEDFTPYVFSMRYGVEGLPGHQGYHGLKGQVSDDFLTIGVPKLTGTSDTFLPYENGFGKVFCTDVVCEFDVQATILCGDIKPDRLFVNGKPADFNAPICLHKGANRIAAGYQDCGRTHLIFTTDEVLPTHHPLAMKWYRNPAVLPFTSPSCPAVQVFTFTAPPGLNRLEIPTTGCIAKVTADSRPIHLSSKNGVCTAALDITAACLCEVRITVEGDHPGGAVFTEPIRLHCGKGRIKTGDWSQLDGLKYYSGGAAYSQTVSLTQEQCDACKALVIEDLSASAEVFVNGQSMGVRVVPPWRWDVSSALIPGENGLRIEVFNTIGNHYEYTPTRYKSGIASGLLGKVWLEFGR